MSTKPRRLTALEVAQRTIDLQHQVQAEIEALQTINRVLKEFDAKTVKKMLIYLFYRHTGRVLRGA